MAVNYGDSPPSRRKPLVIHRCEAGTRAVEKFPENNDNHL